MMMLSEAFLLHGQGRRVGGECRHRRGLHGGKGPTLLWEGKNRQGPTLFFWIFTLREGLPKRLTRPSIKMCFVFCLSQIESLNSRSIVATWRLD